MRAGKYVHLKCRGERVLGLMSNRRESVGEEGQLFRGEKRGRTLGFLAAINPLEDDSRATVSSVLNFPASSVAKTDARIIAQAASE